MKATLARQTPFAGLIAIALVGSAAPSSHAQGIQWVGGFETGSEWQFLRLRLAADGKPTATVDLPRPDACSLGIPTEQLRIDGGRLHFTVRNAGQLLTFDGSLGPDSSVRGTVARGNDRNSLRLWRLEKIDPQVSAAYLRYVGNYRFESGRTILVTEVDGMPVYLDSLRFAKLHPLSDSSFLTDDGETITFTDGPEPAGGLTLESWGGTRVGAHRVALYREERLHYPSGEVTLGGTLLLPRTPGPVPAIVMVHGSNAQRREGYRFLGGDYFARHGIAALIYDKRGVGESGGNWRGSPLDTLASDALAGVHLLERRPEIDPKHIGLYGISQGGWIIPLAAARSPDVAFLISVSGNVIKLWEQETLRQLGEMRARGVSEPLVEQADSAFRLFYRSLQAGKTTEPVDTMIDRLRQAGVPTPLKSTEIRPNAWFKFLDPFYDPIDVLRRVRQPVLWIFGEIDLITPPKPNLERLEPLLASSPRPAYTIQVFPKANHMIWRGETGSGLEVLCLREYDPGYFSAMVKWIRRVVGQAQ